jgi:hypothetical protein
MRRTSQLWCDHLSVLDYIYIPEQPCACLRKQMKLVYFAQTRKAPKL